MFIYTYISAYMHVLVQDESNMTLPEFRISSNYIINTNSASTQNKN